MDEVLAARDSDEVEGVIGKDSVDVDGDRADGKCSSLRTAAPNIAVLSKASAPLPGAVPDDEGASSDSGPERLRWRC